MAPPEVPAIASPFCRSHPPLFASADICLLPPFISRLLLRLFWRHSFVARMPVWEALIGYTAPAVAARPSALASPFAIPSPFHQIICSFSRLCCLLTDKNEPPMLRDMTHDDVRFHWLGTYATSRDAPVYDNINASVIWPGSRKIVAAVVVATLLPPDNIRHGHIT